MEWLRDELPLASLPEGIEELKELFDRAVGDYLCEYGWIDTHRFCLATNCSTLE